MDNNKRGCLAEYQFVIECLKRGYEVSMPILDASTYDCIVDTGSKLHKIQIKSTIKVPDENRSTIHVPLQNNKALYTKDRVDYFAVWSSFFNGFFVFENFGRMAAVRISLDGKYSKYFNNFDFE